MRGARNRVLHEVEDTTGIVAKMARRDGLAEAPAAAAELGAATPNVVELPPEEEGAMNIREFRVVVRAKRFDDSCRFYQETMALPRVGEWRTDHLRAAIFQVGAAQIEVIGRNEESPLGWDETFDYVGPEQKLTLTLTVPSAEKAYETLLFRDRNIPGGLHRDDRGALVFATHDPDGLKIVFREEGGEGGTAEDGPAADGD